MSSAIPAANWVPTCRVVLVEPLIPDNTGNIGRTCVGTESELHLVGPLGFEIDEKRVKRAGLDYWPHLHMKYHNNFQDWQKSVGDSSRIFYVETSAEQSLFDVNFQAGDWLVFGKETSGLDKRLIEQNAANSVYIPMFGPTRSLNLSNAVAIAVFELIRQTRFTSSPRVR